MQQQLNAQHGNQNKFKFGIPPNNQNNKPITTDVSMRTAAPLRQNMLQENNVFYSNELDAQENHLSSENYCSPENYYSPENDEQYGYYSDFTQSDDVIYEQNDENQDFQIEASEINQK